MNEKNEQIKAVMADEAFVQACVEAENEEAVQKLFAGKGIEMSLTEIRLMKKMVSDVAEGSITEEQLEQLSNAGELSEDELAEAAGGNIFKTVGSLYEWNGLSREFVGVGEKVSIPRVAAAVIIAVGAAYGIAKACGVDVEGGIKKGYNWVTDKVTSRW